MTVLELDKTLEAERALGIALDDYAGQWVAVHNHQVIANAESLGGLVEQVKAQGLEEEVEALQVPKDPNAACFY